MSEHPLSPAYDALARAAAGRSAGGACPTCGEPDLRVGTDVQEVAAVADSVERLGAAYLERVYLPQEVADCLGGGTTWGPGAVASLAGRYAVKEAVTKVLRPVCTSVAWNHVEVVRQPGGWCTLALHHDARRLAERCGLSQWALSFAHDGAVAVATVIARHDCGG
ncbi:MAG: Holo-[acyl-carrier-protein] synthase [Marmoricola sp.]|nr:Holo-[acyl-carrier-protein] synthase [Marmoricola sp.]